MAIYKLVQRLEFVKEISFKYEKDIQNIVENNLQKITQ